MKLNIVSWKKKTLEILKKKPSWKKKEKCPFRT